MNFSTNAERTNEAGCQIVTSEQAVQVACQPLDEKLGIPVDAFDLKTAAQMADVLVSNEQLLDRLLGT